MKFRSLFVSLIFLYTCQSIFAYGEGFVNKYPLSGKDSVLYYSYEISEITNALIGDTIQIEFDASLLDNRDAETDFILSTPDTIWIDKEVKRPRVNKHYYLNYIFEGKTTDDEKSHGAPKYRNSSFSDKYFVVNEASPNTGTMLLTELLSGKKVTYKNLVSIKITSESINKRLNSRYPYAYFVPTKYNYDTFKDSCYRSPTEFVFSVFFNKELYIHKNAKRVFNYSKMMMHWEEHGTPVSYEYRKPINVTKYSFISIEEGQKYFERYDKEELNNLAKDSVYCSAVYVTAQKVGYNNSYSHERVVAYIYKAEGGPNYPDYYVIHHGKSYKLSYYNIYSSLQGNSAGASAGDKEYLLKRLEKGSEIRLKNALKADSVQIELDEIRTAKIALAVQQKLDSFDKKKIFLIGSKTERGDYSYKGIELKFYNCFNKPIKYINFRCQSYNKFNDPQSDKHGKLKGEGRCIGPIDEKETGIYDFDEIYWDEYGVIDEIKLTYIKITFVDNTQIEYNGWNNIKVHYEKFDAGNINY